MNWKSEAVSKLRRLDMMLQAAKNLPEELARLEAAAVTLGEDRDALLSNRVQRKETEAVFHQVRAWIDTVNRAMSALSAEEKLVLHRLYICPERGGIDRLCEELGVEQTSIYRRRNAALRKFTIAMYGSYDG